MITYVLAVICVLLLTALIFAVITLFRFSGFIFELEDSVEESLDILDQRHQKINDVLQIPVAGDDPMIRNIINEIKLAREAVLLVANKLVSFTLIRERDEEQKDA